MFCNALPSFYEIFLAELVDLHVQFDLRCSFPNPNAAGVIPSFVPFHECLSSIEIIEQTK